MSPTAVLIPKIPPEAEVLVAKETKDILADRLGRLSTFDIKGGRSCCRTDAQYPASAARLLVQSSMR